MMEKQYRNVLVLSGCQATLQATTTIMVAVTGLAGFALVDDKAFATVPLTCYVLGSAVTTIPASPLMHAIGRRGGFQARTSLGMLGAAICAVAMYIASFWLLRAGMAVLGLGWNFMYIGGTALLTECHTPAERGKTQAANDFMVFVTMAISSAASGLLLSKSGWHAVNYGSLPFLVLAAAATAWLMWQRRAANQPAVRPAPE